MLWVVTGCYGRAGWLVDRDIALSIVAVNNSVKEELMQAKVAVYADVLNLASSVSKALYNFLLIAGGSLAIALAARVYIPLQFTPVPITGQTLMVLLAGTLLGSKRGAASVITYLGLGVAGIPLFAGGGVGFARLFGPTGGYLIGFVAAAYVTGYLAERGWDRRIFTAALAMLAGSVIIYIFGLPRLAVFTGWDRVLALGLYPFIAGDMVKLAAATLLLPGGWKFVGTSEYKHPSLDGTACPLSALCAHRVVDKKGGD
ncbi:MAG: biotin transporter BioY [candidate division WOR-3 bacterium]|nr:biotin transporter BioY [candidate division WOR-3 bacterium]